jgi:hypothetical protein
MLDFLGKLTTWTYPRLRAAAFSSVLLHSAAHVNGATSAGVRCLRVGLGSLTRWSEAIGQRRTGSSLGLGKSSVSDMCPTPLIAKGGTLPA